MASNPQDQTQYASDNGEVPIAAKDQSITRDNPYDQTPVVSPAITIPEQEIKGRAIDPMLADALGNPETKPSTAPMTGTDYLKSQIGSAEGRKETVAAEATNLSRGQDEIARINREAEAEQRRMMFGNPEELLKAQEQLQTATAAQPKPLAPGQFVPPSAEMTAAQQKIQENMGARPLLAKAMVDAENRDKALMAKINAAAAEQIDPDRWWNSKSTGGKILAGIGMVLGGAGGGLQGTGRNPALEVMNKAIDDDMAAQRHHIDNSWKAIATEHGLNTDAFNRELHRQTWEADFRKGAMENIKLQLGKAAATTQSETVKNNAMNMIQSLSDEQAKIRNDQWKLGVQAQQAQLNRMRGLSKDADADVQKLMEKDGVSYQDAVDAVYARPHFRELVGAGMAPPEQAAKAMLKVQYGQEMAKQQKQAALLGAKPGDAKYEAIMDVVRNDPKYTPLFREQGVVVPFKPSEKGLESNKDLDARTVGHQPDGSRILAANPGQADEYKAKTGAAQQWDANVTKLQTLNAAAEKQGGLNTAQVAEWNALRSDMIAIYGVMKEGSKKLPNESEAKRLSEDIIGNPPNGSLLSTQFGTTLSASDMRDKVNVRMSNLANISNEARKAAELTLQQSAGPASATSPNTKPNLPPYARPTGK